MAKFTIKSFSLLFIAITIFATLSIGVNTVFGDDSAYDREAELKMWDNVFKKYDQDQKREARMRLYDKYNSDDGLFSMVDIKADSRHRDNIDHPMGPFLYTVSLMHCMPVGLNENGRGLGMMWGRQKALEFLKEAGFNITEVLDIPNDNFNLHFLSRK